MRINRPEVVAEVTAAFAGYEEALVANDTARLAGYFWDSPQTLRFGLADHQLSASELREWRDAQPPLPPGRELSGTRVVTFGTELATVTTFFAYPSTDKVGRQSQTWVRFAAGWRIVSAHVSVPAKDEPATTR